MAESLVQRDIFSGYRRLCPSSPPTPPLSFSRLLPALSRPGPDCSRLLKHVGGAADESGEREAQQDHHTAGTRPENLGNVPDSQANG